MNAGLTPSSSGRYSTAEREDQAQTLKFGIFRKCKNVTKVVAIENSFL